MGLIARDEAALEGGAARDRRDRAAALTAAVADVADPDAVFAAATRIERELGPVDMWVNDAMETVISSCRRYDPAGVPARYRGHAISASCMATLAALKSMRRRRPGPYRPDRLGAGLPRHPVAIGILRRQARHPRLHRFLAYGTHSQQVPASP